MSNEYFDWPARSVADRFVRFDTVRSGDFNDALDLVSAGFEMLPTAAQVWGSYGGYAVAGGSANALTATIAATRLTALVDGLTVRMRFTAANTVAGVTFNLNGLGAKTVRRANGSALAVSDIASGMVSTLTYSSATDQWLMAQAPVSDTAADINAANLAAASGSGLIGHGTGTVANSIPIRTTHTSGANTRVATSDPTLTALVQGRIYQHTSTVANTLASCTLNISGLGAIPIKRDGSNPAVGELAVGKMFLLQYDGTNFNILNADAGRLINVQTFTASGTYTPTPGTKSIVVEVQGGGGGTGGIAATAAAQWAAGRGGGGGGYAMKRITTLSDFSGGVAVTIGAGGAAGTSAPTIGGVGGTTSFGALVTATGGGAGLGGNPQSAVGVTGAGSSSAANGGSGTGGDIVIPGQPAVGVPGAITLTDVLLPGGGGSFMGAGAACGSLSGTGNASASSPLIGYGGGAAAGGNLASQAARAGAAGAPGICIVWEYA